MYRDQNRLLVLSGIFSFLFFTLILVLIGWQVSISANPLAFAAIQSDVISVSLVTSPSKIEKSEPVHEPEAQQEESDLKQEPEKEITKAESKPAVPEITDLFSNVKIKTIPQKSQQNSEKLSELNALEQKVLSSKRESKLLEKAKGLDLAKSTVRVVASSTGPIVNEYYAKVQGIIYANFHPVSGTEGFSARVRIVLSSDGKLESYRVLNSSGNSVFNSEVDWLKERLRQVSLPHNPNGGEATFEIILTAKD
jgi:protein TonB